MSQTQFLTKQLPTNSITRNIVFFIASTALNVPVYLNNIPFSGTITGWTLDGQNVSGSAVVDLWKVAYASYPPTVANTITGSALPTLSSQKNNTSTTLTGWTTSITAGDVIAANLNSITTITNLCLTIQITIS